MISSENDLAVFVEEFEIAFTGLILKCDDEFLGCLVKFMTDGLKHASTNLTSMHPLFTKEKK